VDNLILILFAIFAGVALMVVLGERFAKPMDPEQVAKWSRWLYPLVGLSLVLGIARYYL